MHSQFKENQVAVSCLINQLKSVRTNQCRSRRASLWLHPADPMLQLVRNGHCKWKWWPFLSQVCPGWYDCVVKPWPCLASRIPQAVEANLGRKSSTGKRKKSPISAWTGGWNGENIWEHETDIVVVLKPRNMQRTAHTQSRPFSNTQALPKCPGWLPSFQLGWGFAGRSSQDHHYQQPNHQQWFWTGCWRKNTCKKKLNKSPEHSRHSL